VPHKRSRKSNPAAAPGNPLKSSGVRADKSTRTMLDPVELAEIRRLIRLVQRTGIGELEVSSKGRTVRISAAGVSRTGAPVVSAGPPMTERRKSDEGAGARRGDGEKSEASTAINSPMVGTFYRAPAPDADPYVEVGDKVDVGQTVCIVEAMKLMNEIESEVRGRIVEVLVENAQPVEFGQKLFLVAPI
jgi:oxaloacetate decarboxylase alpha subunit